MYLIITCMYIYMLLRGASSASVLHGMLKSIDQEGSPGTRDFINFSPQILGRVCPGLVPWRLTKGLRAVGSCDCENFHIDMASGQHQLNPTLG